ncbi:MAG: aminodeoxychorismate synthase component I [Saprospiraceae bacterium]|nr:aminodeoxychorismate synthase component I [Saprospiraceae bacterium]
MTIPAWAQQMDQLAAEGIPFLFVLDFELVDPYVIPLKEIEQTHEAGIQFQINNTKSETSPSTREINFSKIPVSLEVYRHGFNQVMKAIKAGDTYLLNLCYSTQMIGLPSLKEIFEVVSAPYKLYLPGKFVVFSPEQFVSIEDGIIRTFPMKGTIDAALSDAEAVLLADIKEQEEHATVVDLLRNDLSIVSRKVTVDQYRYISKITTPIKSLLQCSSAISGILEDEYVDKPGSIMHALLPAGSVTGAPKKKTVELITTIEPEPRGYYTGVFGVFDGKNLDSAVMIRMIEERADGFYYRSGGGITYRSVAEQEYQELMDKVYTPV